MKNSLLPNMVLEEILPNRADSFMLKPLKNSFIYVDGLSFWNFLNLLLKIWSCSWANQKTVTLKLDHLKRWNFVTKKSKIWIKFGQIY